MLGIPELFPNGYPNMAENHQYIGQDGDIIRDVTRRINHGGYIIPPPPIPQYQPPKEEPQIPMTADVIDEIKNKDVRITPSGTSSLNDYMTRYCGSTITDITSTLTKPKDPLVLDHTALKRFLIKMFPWILDVTEVRIRPETSLGRIRHILQETPDGKIMGRLQIHITVSPIHYTELMNPNIEKKVREKLYAEMLPLITCMFEEFNRETPSIIFSPTQSETILEYVK